MRCAELYRGLLVTSPRAALEAHEEDFILLELLEPGVIDGYQECKCASMCLRSFMFLLMQGNETIKPKENLKVAP